MPHTTSGLPLVSVIMPAYNSVRYIAEAITSVLTQDYPRIELIVVDDGSSDGTADAARAFGDKVTVLCQDNAGPAAARNRGISIANGDLIAFLDSDDVWLPGKLSAQVAYLRDDPDVGVVFGDFQVWKPNPDGTFSTPPAPSRDESNAPLIEKHSGWIYPHLLLDSVIHIITALISKEVVQRIGQFDETLPTGEDYDFWLRVTRSFRAVRLNRTLAYYRLHEQGTTRVARADNNEYRVLMRSIERLGPPSSEDADFARLLAWRFHSLCFKHGYLHFWEGDACVAATSFRMAASYAPLQMRAWLYWILSILKCRMVRLMPRRVTEISM